MIIVFPILWWETQPTKWLLSTKAPTQTLARGIREVAPAQNPLRAPWIQRNLWYQLANFTVNTVTPYSCVVCMGAGGPKYFAGVPHEQDPFTCHTCDLTVRPQCPQNPYQITARLGKTNYSLCQTHCLLKAGSTATSQLEPYKSLCTLPRATVKVQYPADLSGLTPAPNTTIICYNKSRDRQGPWLGRFPHTCN